MTSWSPYTDNHFDDWQPSDIEILYEDEHLIAVHKPAGMLVHVGWGKAEVVLVDLMRDIVQSDQVHTIHRLDRPTSGVVLFAQHPEAARALCGMFETHTIQKQYLTLVRGECPELAWIDYAIPKQRKDPERVEARTAIKRLYFAQETTPREVSLVLVAPQTGRTHQIRRHLRHMNHPLIGDANYGRSKLNRGFRENYQLSRLALHAQALSFKHPMDNTPMHIEAPLPQDMRQAFDLMGVPTACYTGPFNEVSWIDRVKQDPERLINT